MKVFVWIGRLLVAFGLLVLLTQPAAAQGSIDWREQQTEKFSILYAAGDELEAQIYADFVDLVYEEVSALFSFRTATPLSLRLFPTNEDYFRANPQARGITGIVAHADFRRRELVVIIEQTRFQSEEEVRNNIRHELTHIIAADMSGNRLNVGFHEGTALYLERPSEELERRISALRSTFERNQLLPWSAFDDRSVIYGQPEISYPQALSVTSFLVERYGFSTYRDFLTNSALSSGYRSALERTYDSSARQLEEQWLAWLPSYLEGGYRRNALTSYDLGFPQRLIAEGRYEQAREELGEAIEWLEQNPATQSPETLAEAQQLLAESENGLQAERLAQSARLALDNSDYEAARQLTAQANERYAALNDQRQNAVLGAYEERARQGLAAQEQLREAEALARNLRFPMARSTADEAAAAFAALGDGSGFVVATGLRNRLDQQQKLLGGALLGVGCLGILVSTSGLIFRRETEVW